MEKSQLNRRQFIGATAVAAAASTVFPRFATGQVLGANDRIGIGVIGCGGRGHSHLETAKSIAHRDKSVEIVAVCDTYRGRLQPAADKYKAKAYMKHQELLADPNVDMVSIATPDHIHGYQVIDAVKAKKHVYCEKPVTHWRQFNLVRDMAKAVKESGCTFQLGTQGMSDGAWHKMRQLVEEGLIGKVLQAECGYYRTGDWGERGMGIDDPNVQPGPDLDWEAFLGDSPKRDFDVSRYFRWRMYSDYAGGPVTDLFPHSLTPVMSIIGVGMPSSAVGMGSISRYSLADSPDEVYHVEREVPDTFSLIAEFPEKVTVIVTGTQGNQYQGGGDCGGDRGAGGRIPVIRGWDGTLTLKGDEIVFIPTPESKKEAKTFKIEYGENMMEHYRNLIACAQKGSQDTWSPADLALRTQAVLLMGNAAWRAGKTATYDPAKEEIVV